MSQLFLDMFDDMPVNENNYTQSDTITFNAGSCLTTEMLRISSDGFWVRGVKVAQDKNEAAVVYKAFKQWMVEAELRRPWI